MTDQTHDTGSASAASQTSAATSLTAVVVVGVALALATAVSWAGGDGGVQVAYVPATVVVMALAFLIQWVAFVPAWLQRTEHFYDLVGGATYLTLVVLALTMQPQRSARAALLAALICVWATRLALFLFRRVRRVGKDGRFDAIKQSAPRFFIAWSLQGLWVSLTASAAWAAILSLDQGALGALDIVGVLVWATGFGIEVVADRQKSNFRRSAENEGHFISTGLWAWSRHPNYFGEITLWTGIALIAAGALSGWQWVTLVSPFFVAILLLRISGVPLLEQRAAERWGDDAAYRAYRAGTSLLIPLPPRRPVGGPP